MGRHVGFGLAVVGVLVLGLSACGSDNTASPPTDAGGTVGTSAPATAAVEVSPQEGAAMIQSMGAALTIVDVRTPAEFASGHIEGAVNLDLEGGQFSALIADLPTDAPYLVYCHSGRRSALASATMIDAGFTDVSDLGGIADWQAAGLPVVAG